jgi:putative flippase GtrA
VIVKVGKRLAKVQSIRFLVVGGCNTLFGIADSLLLLKLFLLLEPAQPKWMGTTAMGVSSLINIGFSFLTYKWFVFRTKGNYGREYLRSLTIYLPSLAVSTLLVAPLAALLHRWTGYDRGSVYIAIGLIISFTIVFGFFGHKHVSFKQSGTPDEGTIA